MDLVEYPMKLNLLPYSTASTPNKVTKPGNVKTDKFSYNAAQTLLKLECGQMPNVMVALPNTGGALCSTPQSLADAHYWSAVQ